MSLINYEELEVAIKEVEDVLEDYDNEEKSLIIKCIAQRKVLKDNQQRVQEDIGKLKFGGILKKIIKEEQEDK